MIKVNSLEDEKALVNSFKWMLDNAETIREKLKIMIKEKQEQIFSAYQKIIKK